jgi:hypothetical protein
MLLTFSDEEEGCLDNVFLPYFCLCEPSRANFQPTFPLFCSTSCLLVTDFLVLFSFRSFPPFSESGIYDCVCSIQATTAEWQSPQYCLAQYIHRYSQKYHIFPPLPGCFKVCSKLSNSGQYLLCSFT